MARCQVENCEIRIYANLFLHTPCLYINLLYYEAPLIIAGYCLEDLFRSNPASYQSVAAIPTVRGDCTVTKSGMDSQTSKLMVKSSMI